MKRIIATVMSIGMVLCSCKDNQEKIPNDTDVNYRQSMRDFVTGISAYARSMHPGFIVIPQNGQELITDSGESDGTLQTDFISAIDGTGREDLFFGYDQDDKATSSSDRDYMLSLCQLYKRNSLTVLTTDYCSTHSKMDSSYSWNEDFGFISFAANERDLNSIPAYPATPYHLNDENINSLSEIRNFLYLINSERYDTKSDFLSAVAQTNYDLVITDLYHNETIFTADEIALLKQKQNGGSRIILCYMSIGEAEDYRYYWQSDWKVGNPDWLAKENPEWEGNYKVKYWDAGWQSIIYGNDDSYMKKILEAGYDGVYLDIIDAFEYFE